MATTNGKRWLRFKAVQQRVDYSKSQIYALIKAGKFPAPYKLAEGCRASFWDEAEIDALFTKEG